MRFIIAIVAWAASIAILTLMAPDATQQFLTNEGGLIESASIAAYAVCLMYILALGEYARFKWIFWLVVLLLLRELDFDSRFTDAKVFKVTFLLNGDVPVGQKIYAVGLLAISLLVVIKVITTNASAFLRHLRARSQVATGTILIVALILASKLLDGATRKFKYVGVSLSEHGAAGFQVAEEISEFFIPVMIALTISCAITQAGEATPHE